MAEKLYTTAQAAKAAKISRQTLHAWMDSGKVKPPSKIGNNRVWTQSQVNELKKIPRKEK